MAIVAYAAIVAVKRCRTLAHGAVIFALCSLLTYSTRRDQRREGDVGGQNGAQQQATENGHDRDRVLGPTVWRDLTDPAREGQDAVTGNGKDQSRRSDNRDTGVDDQADDSQNGHEDRATFAERHRVDLDERLRGVETEPSVEVRHAEEEENCRGETASAGGNRGGKNAPGGDLGRILGLFGDVSRCVKAGDDSSRVEESQDPVPTGGGTSAVILLGKNLRGGSEAISARNTDRQPNQAQQEIERDDEEREFEHAAVHPGRKVVEGDGAQEDGFRDSPREGPEFDVGNSDASGKIGFEDDHQREQVVGRRLTVARGECHPSGAGPPGDDEADDWEEERRVSDLRPFLFRAKDSRRAYRVPAASAAQI